ncbi:MAG: DUF1566 domain-containing protein [Bacteroidetes bacterium]|nr:DUF1566 domain-containing protein [Bacteroidota bacterium]
MKKIIFIAFCLMIFSCKKENISSGSDIAVGKSYAGGIIFYVDGTGLHGLIAATSDQSTSTKWSEGNNVETGASEVAVGLGQQNTNAILTSANISEGCSCNCAASVVDQLVLSGYSDWFLPSKGELNLLYQQKDIVGGFTNNYYWSSTEHDSLSAWNQYFPFGPQYYANKDSNACIRAIRAF